MKKQIKSPLGLTYNVTKRKYEFSWIIGKRMLKIPCSEKLAKLILAISR